MGPLTLPTGGSVYVDANAVIYAAVEMDLIPATLAIREDAARIRAATGLKTSDALHAVTALPKRTSSQKRRS